MLKSVRVRRYDSVVVVETTRGHYAMTWDLWETRVKPNLLIKGYEVTEEEATPEEKWEVQQLAFLFMVSEDARGSGG